MFEGKHTFWGVTGVVGYHMTALPAGVRSDYEPRFLTSCAQFHNLSWKNSQATRNPMYVNMLRKFIEFIETI